MTMKTGRRPLGFKTLLLAGVAIASACGDDDGSGSGGSYDNVAACQEWVDNFECGQFDISGDVSCSSYDVIRCDITIFFECLDENTVCEDGFPSIPFGMCMSMIDCG